jgi:hypothetical protein
MPPRVALRLRTALVLLAAVLFCLTRTHRAHAWVEVHVAGDDVRLDIDPAGAARIEHKITLKISGGPLRSLDITGVDPDAAPEPDGYVVPFRDATTNSLAAAVPVGAELLPPDLRPREDGTPHLPKLRVRFDQDRGLSRGVFVLFVRYRTQLAERGLFMRDGSMARIRWTGPVWEDGFDSARAVFALPPGATPPRWDEAAGEEADSNALKGTFLSTLRRGRDQDELELMRPYAAKGEAIVWAVRFDGRALKVGREEPSADEPAPLLPRISLPSDWRPTLSWVGGGALFLLYSLLVGLKWREVGRAARSAGVDARPVLRMPLWLRCTVAGLALVLGVALQFHFDLGSAGAIFIALGVALSAHRTPRWTHATTLRKPGRWLPVSEAVAFASPPRPRGAYLDVTTRAGKVLLSILLAGLAGGVVLLGEQSPFHASLLAFDSVVLLAMFCTGRLAELPPDPAVSPAPFLRDVARAVRKIHPGEEVRIVGRIHVPQGSPDADELRLAIVVKSPLGGFSTIEVGVVYAPGAGGAIALPEVLLRLAGDSPCEKALQNIARHGRSMRGRKPGERVIGFSPRLPNAKMTAAIAAALVTAVKQKGETRKSRSSLSRAA